jgi:hypothetical protein
VLASHLGASGSISCDVSKISGVVDEVALEQILSPSLYGFTSLIIIPPLLSTHVSSRHEMCDTVDQAAHYHILKVWGFIPEPVPGWLQIMDVNFL